LKAGALGVSPFDDYKFPQYPENCTPKARSSALSEHQMNFQHEMRESRSIDRFNAEGERMVETLKAEVQKTLWDSMRQ
jgi:hypothetical protein